MKQNATFKCLMAYSALNASDLLTRAIEAEHDLSDQSTRKA